MGHGRSMMFGPKVQVEETATALLAEFWDCHRLDPKPVADLRKILERHLGRGVLRCC